MEPYSNIFVYDAGVSGTVSEYTVPDNKQLLIYSAWLSAQTEAAASGTGSMYIRDVSDVTTYYMTLIRHSVVAGATRAYDCNVMSYVEPLVVPAGYDVVFTSSGAVCDVDGGFFGHLINA